MEVGAAAGEEWKKERERQDYIEAKELGYLFGAKHRKKQVKNDLIAQGQEGKGAAEKKVEEDVQCTCMRGAAKEQVDGYVLYERNSRGVREGCCMKRAAKEQV